MDRHAEDFREYSRKRRGGRDSRDMSWYFAAQTSQLGATCFQLNARGGCYHGHCRNWLENVIENVTLQQHALAVHEGPPGESSFVFLQNLCDISRRDARRSSIETREQERPTVRKRGNTMTSGDAVGAADLARRIGQRLRDERTARDMSLDDLSRASGVSRAALSQIETRKSSPSMAVMWKIAVGLGIPFTELLGGDTEVGHVLRRGDAQVLRSPDGRMESRPIAPAGTTPWVEVFELRLSARSTHRSEAHAAGTREIFVVLSGAMKIEIGGATYELEAGDSVAFRADQAHAYINPGASEARAHNVIIYPRT